MFYYKKTLCNKFELYPEWKITYTTGITVLILVLALFNNAGASENMASFPYVADNLDELKIIVAEKERRSLITSQEIDLGGGLRVIGFYESVGSGIERLNAYIYTCERNRCLLFLFLRTPESKKISIEFLYDSQEMILKASSGEIVFRTAFPYLAMIPRKPVD
jgi:hypothetical protein